MNSTIGDPTQQSCNLLMNTDLTDNWENIPQTLLINCILGLVLFMSFIIMTQIAWTQSDNDKRENLISFLYGHRDPEKWYIIPRFEFLKRSDRSHHHELDWQKIYIPPKLPTANPMSMFDLNSQDNESLDETQTLATVQLPAGKSKDLPSNSDRVSTMQFNSMKLDTSSAIGSEATTNNRPSRKTLTQKDESDQPPLPNRTNLRRTSKKSVKIDPLDKPFFYPSILISGQLQASYLSRKLNAFFSKFSQITDADMIYAKGIDAYEYLLFQRHLILIMLITNLFCLGVILPVHWLSGDNLNSNLVQDTDQYPLYRHNASFQHTTIKNMKPKTTLYWVHIVSSVCIVIITLIILKSYRESIINRDDSQLARRTLLVGNIAPEHRNRRKLHQIFDQYFPHSKLEAVQFVYDISLLEQYQLQLDAIVVAREYSEKFKRKHNRDILIKPSDVNESQTCNGNCRLCSFFYICLCNWPNESKVPASEYYAHREAHYRNLIKDACEKMVNAPSEYAFVTLKTNRQTRRVMSDLAKLKTELMGANQDGLRARKSLKRLKSQSGGKTIKSAAGSRPASVDSTFLQTSHNTLSDPLDPKNNPRVRSIRSPVAKQLSNVALKHKTAMETRGKAIDEMTEHDSIEEPDTKGQQVKSIRLRGPLGWSVRYAPHPDNVEYYDILNIATTSKYTIAFLHLVMVVIFIFFTTPNVLLSILDRLSVLKPSSYYGFLGVFMNYLTTIVQIVTTAILPYLIGVISKQIPYENSASKTHSTMWKVYLFLVLMVIVMPSIGMESALAIIYSRSGGGNQTDSRPTRELEKDSAIFVSADAAHSGGWNMGEYKNRPLLSAWCLFPVDNGSYYVNYVISSIFISTCLELIKPADIISYYFILFTGRSVADYEGGRQFIQREFSISMQHTGVLLIFSVVMTYAISCPLIAPAGLLFLLVKHAVDHYHLFYTYFTKKTDKNLHNTMEIFVKVAILLMLFQTAIAILIKTGKSSFVYLSQIVFWTTSVIFLYNCFFDLTTRQTRGRRKSKFQREFCACFYLPRVFEDLLRLDALPASCVSRKI